VLPGISTEQLRSRLNRMVADGLLTRKRYREVPPRVDYELTERSYDLMPVLGALARWGYEWAWGPPRAGEDVDVGAILRLAPGLLHPPHALRGTLAIAATGKHGQPRDYMLRVAGGRVGVTERTEPRPDARVSGSRQAWIDALGPDGDRGGLKLSGDRRLAATLLDGLAVAAARSSAAA
jgi:hypothetical protein